MVYAAILATLMVAQAPEVKYDKFEDQTAIRLRLGWFDIQDDSWQVSFTVYHDGKGPHRFTADHTVWMAVTRLGKGWKFLDGHKLGLMVGDQHIPHSGDDFKTSDGDRKNTECFLVGIKIRDMKKYLDKNADWEIKAGDQEPFSIGKKERAAMKQLVELLQKGN